MNVGDGCYRDSSGAAALSLPWRVILPDGTTRTDPSQWSADPAVMEATGWTLSTLTEADIAALTTPAPVPSGWVTPGGWLLRTEPADVALLTGLYVLAARREQLGVSQPVTVVDAEGHRHSMPFAEFEVLMLAYGAAMEAANAS